MAFLCAIALGITAIGASGAQAAPVWMIGNMNINSTLAISLTLTIQTLAASEGLPGGKEFALLSEANGTKFAISCTIVGVPAGAALEATGHGKAKLSFSDCETYLEPMGKPTYKLSALCAPATQPIVVGGITEIAEHNGVAYLKMTGPSGLFGTLQFNCAELPEEIEIKGAAWFEDANGVFETEGLNHVFREAATPASALGGLKAGLHSVKIDGSAKFELFEGGVMRNFSGLK